MNNNDSSDNLDNPNLSRTQYWQKFTFFCHTSNDEIDGKDYVPGDSVFCLSECQVGDLVRIVKLQVSNNARYLKNMGLTPGAEIIVKSCSNTGSVIVALEEKSFGFGAEIALKIFVTRV